MGKKGKRKTILSASKEMANGSYRRKVSSFPCRGGIRWVEEEEEGGVHTFFRIIAARDIWGLGYGGGLFFDKVR